MDERNESQIKDFLSGLTDDEVGLIWACYENAHFINFDKLIEWGIETNAPGFNKDVSTIKKLAVFEETYQVKLYELLNISEKFYEGHKITMVESVLLPVGIADDGNNVDVHLGVKEQFTLHTRDMFYAGSWSRMRNDIILNKNSEQTQYLPVLDNLRNYEEKHKVNLGVLLREFVPLEVEDK